MRLVQLREITRGLEAYSSRVQIRNNGGSAQRRPPPVLRDATSMGASGAFNAARAI
jgi:hypothetical protein